MRCCAHHWDGCRFGPCCDRCPEPEKCHARMKRRSCVLPMSQHSDPRSTDPSAHRWDERDARNSEGGGDA